MNTLRGTFVLVLTFLLVTIPVDIHATFLPIPPIQPLQPLLQAPYCFIAPLICPTKNVRFYLYTSSYPASFTELDVANPESIKRAKFVPGPVKILIHGYFGDRDYTPNREIRPAYLRSGKIVNVISVDYGPLVRLGCYIFGVRNTAVAAKCTAQLIENILRLRTDIKLSQIHVIGLSLGAQVAGQIAVYLTVGQLERISVLDAALPLFYRAITPPFREINRGDAKRIDALHTNAGLAGQDLPIGTSDFYANGGTFQPGCAPLDLKCDHERSSTLFAESINSPTGFRARSCYYPPPTVLGACVKKSGPTVLYGEYLNPNVTGIYAFETAASSPYALPSCY